LPKPIRLSYAKGMKAGQVGALELLAQHYDYGRGPSHARKVAGLATSLFDQLTEHGLLPSIAPGDRQTLYAAGLTHDIGSSARARIDAGELPDWASEMTRDSVGVVSYTLLRRWLENPPAPLANTPLSPADRSALLYSVLWSDRGNQIEVAGEELTNASHTRRLASTLRVAQCLDSTLRGLVSGIKVLRSEHWVRILVRSLGSVENEVADAAAHVSALEQSLGIRVFVQEIVEDAEA